MFVKDKLKEDIGSVEFPIRILTGMGTIRTVTAETRLKLDINSDVRKLPRSFSGRLKNSPPEIYERFAKKNWVRGFIKGSGAGSQSSIATAILWLV